MQRTKWTPEQKAEALRLLAAVGKAETARRLGIPVGTVASWGVRAGVTSPTTEAQRPAVEARQMTMARRKQALADRLLTTAEKLLTRANKPKEEALDVKRLMDAVGVAVEKMQLLSGDVTSRLGMQPTPAAPVEELTPAVERERALAVVHQLSARAS